jgi:hypothetical protein
MTHRTLTSAIPKAPFELLASAVGAGKVIMAWAECGAGGHGFRIERADGIGPACLFSEIGITGAHVTAFRDGSVKSKTTYSYRVHAWNASGKSSPSNVVEVTTPRVQRGPPSDKE